MALEMFDLVVYTIKKAEDIFKDKSICFGKTLLQKIIYFSLLDEQQNGFYVPYHYGPYSEQVQRTIGDLYFHDFIENSENNPVFIQFRQSKKEKIDNYLKQHEKSIDNQIKENIEKVMRFILNNKLSVKDISLLGKIDIIKKRMFKGKNEKNRQSIADKSVFLGWQDEINSISETDFSKYEKYISELTIQLK